jgi:ADP-ribose pyrophosphatase YjhB (NUDIX family)
MESTGTPDPVGRQPVTWEDSYEGQLRKLVGNRPLIIVATRSVVMDQQGRVLLTRRRDSGEWGFPAGALELGESVLDCCRREVKEETGLHVVSAVPIAIYSEPRFASTDRYGNQRQGVAIVLLVREWTGDITPSTNETTDCRFFAMDDLPQLPPLYEETVEDVRRYRGALILK